MKKIVAGNWKMNTTVAQGVELAKEVVALSASVADDVKLVIATPFTHLSEVKKVVDGSRVALSAQNCGEMASGAYTGEVSAEMIADLGTSYVILGHSERREYYGETSDKLVKKMALAFASKLTPIYCVGEKLSDREAGSHFDVVRKQIEEVVYPLYVDNYEKLIVAYEPVWAIGTGVTASAEQAEEMHAFIRQILHDKFGSVAKSTPILYGGSCKPSNAQELFAKPNVNGGLIGGASLSAEDFINIAKGF